MFHQLKEQFFQFLKELGYNVADNATYRDEFPWLLVRTSNANVQQSRNISVERAGITVDIFSTYNGEKEILEITQQITDHLLEFQKRFPAITFAQLKQLRVIDDPGTGPVRKHGVAVFDFILNVYYQEVEAE